MVWATAGPAGPMGNTREHGSRLGGGWIFGDVAIALAEGGMWAWAAQVLGLGIGKLEQNQNQVAEDVLVGLLMEAVKVVNECQGLPQQLQYLDRLEEISKRVHGTEGRLIILSYLARCFVGYQAVAVVKRGLAEFKETGGLIENEGVVMGLLQVLVERGEYGAVLKEIKSLNTQFFRLQLLEDVVTAMVAAGRVSEALQIARSERRAAVRIKLLCAAAHSLVKRGDREAAREICASALQSAHRVRDGNERIDLLADLARVYAKIGMVNAALECARQSGDAVKKVAETLVAEGNAQAFSEMEKLIPQHERCANWLKLAEQHCEAGRKDRAEEMLHSAFQAAAEITNIEQRSKSLVDSAEACVRMERFEQAEAIADRIELPARQAYVLAELATARGKAGNMSEAFLLLQKAMKARDRIVETGDRSAMNRPLAKVVPLLCPEDRPTALHELARFGPSENLLSWLPSLYAAAAAQGGQGFNLLRHSVIYGASSVALSRMVSVALVAAWVRSGGTGHARAIATRCSHLNLLSSLAAQCH